MLWKIRRGKLSLERTLVMGILNITPDSFSDGGAYPDAEKAAARALELEKQGADILDLGAESTRPNAPAVSPEEELKRLLPVLEALRGKLKIPVSIDTTKAEVAAACLENGADIINDVSGLEISGEGMAELAARTGAGLILMHRRGTPETMQSLAVYGDVLEEVMFELEKAVKRAEGAGVLREQIVVDPGLGFSKNAAQNLEILNSFEKLHRAGLPVLAGPSRKSFLGAAAGKDEPRERDWATAAAVSAAVLKGAHIVRVHEVPGMIDVVRVAEKIRGEQHHVRS